MRAEVVSLPHPGFEEDPAYAPEAPRANPLLVLHRLLRGRYPLAVTLGVALAAPLAVLGCFVVPPEYTSTGIVNIAPTRPYILYENEFTERLSSFESFVQSQANILRSQRVLEAAVRSEKLRNAGWEPPPQGLVELAEDIRVDVPRDGQDIFVRVTFTDPRLAQQATNAVLGEYSRIAIDQQALQFQQTIDTVSDLREQARQERDDARSRAYQLAEREGTDDLARRREAKHAQLERIEQLLLDVNFRLLAYGAAGVAPEDVGEDGAGGAPEDVDAETLAEHDKELAAMLARRKSLELQSAALRQQYGPGHRQIVQLEEELAGLQTMIDAATLVARANGGSDGSEPAPQERLRLAREGLETLLRQTTEDARRIGKLQLDIDRLREEADRADETFREADSRLESLVVQKRDEKEGRISIAQWADTPLTPSTDRRIPLAVLGALAGIGIGVGVVVFFGVIAPRYRYISDVESANRDILVLGVIPEIDLEDASSRGFLDTSVHQIRAAIDSRLLGASSGAVVHLVTSASAAEGKTTLALQLARSFAVSGKRTLVIDADMIGRRITAKFDMDHSTGFADAVVRGLEPSGAALSTGEEHLFVMPAGRDLELAPERVSASGASALLNRLRPDFDAIVIDTGPILGSIEAQGIVPACDEVLLVVSRGRGTRLITLAIDRLRRLGAPHFGLVFNRALFQDLERSTSLSMTSRRVSERRGAMSVRSVVEACGTARHEVAESSNDIPSAHG